MSNALEEFISALIERRVKFDRQQLFECFKKFDKQRAPDGRVDKLSRENPPLEGNIEEDIPLEAGLGEGG